ncbi:MAG: hypothetical protein QOE14_2392, partial [Humisphaera sp.]|nr:hypothetical protein [Humisphaera sp.]
YVRKADLLASAIPTPQGGWVVPATAPNYVDRPMTTRHVVNGYAAMRPTMTTSPAARPGQVIIIPRRLMDKNIKDLDQKPLKVASAK